MSGVTKRSNFVLKICFAQAGCACDSSTWEVEKEDSEFKVFLTMQQIKVYLEDVRSCLKKRRNEWVKGEMRDVGGAQRLREKSKAGRYSELPTAAERWRRSHARIEQCPLGGAT